MKISDVIPEKLSYLMLTRNGNQAFVFWEMSGPVINNIKKDAKGKRPIKICRV